jgi:hypothetical protein
MFLAVETNANRSTFPRRHLSCSIGSRPIMASSSCPTDNSVCPLFLGGQEVKVLDPVDDGGEGMMTMFQNHPPSLKTS